jgi:hypothetical protein
MASLPRPLAAAGVWVLRTEQLRMVSVAAVILAVHLPTVSGSAQLLLPMPAVDMRRVGPTCAVRRDRVDLQQVAAS